MENCPSYANSYTPPDSESVASNSKKTILSTVTGDGSSVQTASECYEDRRAHRKCKKKVRSTDKVNFYDLPFASDYEKFLKRSIDPKLQLKVKGPLSNLFFQFKADHTLKIDGESVRRVVTSSRRYQCDAGMVIPCILPDFDSDWYKTKTNIKERTLNAVGENCDFDFSAFQEQMCKEIRQHAKKVAAGVTDPNRQHGLQVFKIVNVEDVICNISNGNVEDTLELADFGTDVKSQVSYAFVNHMLKNKAVTEDDKKDIKSFAAELPPRPVIKSEGFPIGSCKDWVKTTDPNYVPTLMRIKAKLGDLERPDDSRYIIFGRNTLRTDEEILSKLPEKKIFTDIVTGHNGGISILIILIICFD